MTGYIDPTNITRPLKCRRCKCVILEGTHCSPCKELEYQDKVEKAHNRRISKLKGTKEYGIGLVKKYADIRFWANSHSGCFRCGDNESPEHIDAKYQRWKYHRSIGRTVYTELVLKAGYGRPDLIIVDGGDVFAEEILVSEKDASIKEKKGKYPFPISVIKVPKLKIVTSSLLVLPDVLFRMSKGEIRKEVGLFGKSIRWAVNQISKEIVKSQLEVSK